MFTEITGSHSPLGEKLAASGKVEVSGVQTGGVCSLHPKHTPTRSPEDALSAGVKSTRWCQARRWGCSQPPGGVAGVKVSPWSLSGRPRPRPCSPAVRAGLRSHSHSLEGSLAFQLQCIKGAPNRPCPLVSCTRGWGRGGGAGAHQSFLSWLPRSEPADGWPLD